MPDSGPRQRPFSFMKTIDYYCHPASPWTYLGHERFAAIAKRHAAAINVRPVDFGVIFPQSGGLPLPKRAPQRRMAMTGDLLGALWRDDRNLADPALLKEIGTKYGVAEGDTATYERYTQEALQRGVFGAPSYVYRDEIFWGQDRLEFLDRALAK